MSTLNGSWCWWCSAVSRRRCSRPACSGSACVSLRSTVTTSTSRKVIDSAPADLQRRCRPWLIVIDRPTAVVSAWIRRRPVSALSFQRPDRHMDRFGDGWESFIIDSVLRRSTITKPGVWTTDTLVEESVVLWRSHSCPGRSRSAADGRLAVNVGDILVPVRRESLGQWRRRRQTAVAN